MPQSIITLVLWVKCLSEYRLMKKNNRVGKSRAVNYADDVFPSALLLSEVIDYEEVNYYIMINKPRQ